MERNAEGRGREGNAERHAGIEDLDGLVLRMLPVVIVEVGRGELGVFRYMRRGGAGISGVFLGRAWLAVGRPIEAGDLDAGDADFRSAAIHGEQGELYGLSASYQTIVGKRVEGDIVRGEDGILIIALFQLEAEIDFVARGIAKAHGAELGAQRANGGKAGFDGRGGAGIVAIGKCLLGGLGIGENSGETVGKRARRVGPRIARWRSDWYRCLRKRTLPAFPICAGKRGVNQRITAAAAEATTAPAGLRSAGGC